MASRLFEIQGARATTAAYGFDRHWRNLRTHTVHDPVAYKAREIGDWVLNQRARSSRCTADFRAGTRVSPTLVGVPVPVDRPMRQ